MWFNETKISSRHRYFYFRLVIRFRYVRTKDGQTNSNRTVSRKKPMNPLWTRGAFHSPKSFGLNFRKFRSRMERVYSRSSRGQFLLQASWRRLSYVFKMAGVFSKNLHSNWLWSRFHFRFVIVRWWIWSTLSGCSLVLHEEKQFLRICCRNFLFFSSKEHARRLENSPTGSFWIEHENFRKYRNFHFSGTLRGCPKFSNKSFSENIRSIWFPPEIFEIFVEWKAPKDSSVPLMCHDPCDLGPHIEIRIIPKKTNPVNGVFLLRNQMMSGALPGFFFQVRQSWILIVWAIRRVT